MAVTAAEREEFRRMIGPTLERAAADLARIPDPGVREAGAAELLPDALLEMPYDFLSDALDLVAGARGGPELLTSLAVSGPTPIAVGARVRLEALDDPPDGLGSLRVERAWEIDADEPVLGLFLLCSRARASGKQLFSFVVETLVSGGAVKDGFATGTSEGTRMAKKVTGQLPEDVQVREIDPAQASERVVAAAIGGARSGLAPSTDGLRALTIFLRAAGVEDADAIVQAVELGDSLPERVEALEDETRLAAVDALASEAEEWLEGKGERERAEAAAFAVGLMGDFRAFYLDADLTGWSAQELEEFLLDWVPRKVSLTGDDAAGFPEAVADALGFLGATGRLGEQQAEALVAQVRRLEDDFVQGMADPALAGPAKLLFEAMSAEGVEPGDPEAMQAWLDDFNARPFEERDRILGPALPPRASKRPAKAKKRKAQSRPGGETVDAEDDPGEGGRSDASQEARRQFACPPARGRYRGIELEYLDPGDPEDRHFLIAAEHPELRRALERGDEDVVVHGNRINPRLHLVLHEIVANRLWDGDPPETWETAQRLLALGHDRHEVLHMLGSVVAREVWGTLQTGAPIDHERYVAALGELPESYFALAE